MADCGTITIVPPFNESNVTSPGCTVGPSGDVQPSDTVEVDADVQNTNDVDAVAQVRFVANGITLGEDSIQVPANSTTGVSATFVPEDAGLSGSVTVNAEVTSASRA